MNLSVHGSPIILIVSLLLLLSAVYFISIYNRLQKLSNGAESTLSQIRVAMKKRLDMIEQLVDSVKSYARFERGVLENISSMRTRVGSAGPGELTKIESESKGVFGNLMAVAEDYPQLKTSETVMMTMNAIEGMEDEISRHRYTYNNIVQNFNTMLDSIPSKYVASSVGLRKMDYLNFEEDELRRLGYLTTEEEGPSRPEVGWD
jgi:LemA protein